MTVAADIMTKDVVTVSPETPVHHVADVLAANRFGALPVVNADGVVVGIVREEDMVARVAEIHLPRHVVFLDSIIYLENPQHFAEEAQKILAVTAQEIMDPEVDAVRADTPVDEIASRMLAEDLRRFLVLDEHRRLQGIITRADLVRMLANDQQLPPEGG